MDLRRSWEWASARSWKGRDPYDALSSPLLSALRAALGARFGIAATQLLRRLPFDLRAVLAIRPAMNPKSAALFLSAAARSRRTEQVSKLAALLDRLCSRQAPNACWGYPFPWQSRAFYLPAGTPTVVATCFAGEAYLDAHAATRDPAHVEIALGACLFVMEGLNRTEDETGACLSYSPLDRTAVYNASILGARLLALTGQRTGRQDLVDHARPLVTYVLARQASDGSWVYGEARYHRWIDSFHTGFVLGALDVYRRATGDRGTEAAVIRGARFYDQNFFGPHGEPFYHPKRRYPMDVHSAAQGVLTFLQLRDLFPNFEERARTVARWMVENMLDPEGFFYYQVRRTHTVRIPYMRWSQAWGVRALAELVHCGIEI